MKADEVRLYALRGGLKKQAVCYTHFHSNKVFRGDHNNIIDRAFQDFAELVYCRCADRLIMPQPIYRTAADVMFGDQRVGRYFVPVKVIPKRFVCYHCRTSFRKTERKNPSGLKFPLDI